jgi:hypothetical protein
MALTNAQIAALEKKGFARWQKGSMDRLYINSTRIGLTVEYYKTGNIHYAELNGEHISNSRAYSIKAAKNYVDVSDGSIHTDYSEIRGNIQAIMDEIAAV